MDRKAAWLIGLIVLVVALALLAPLGILTAGPSAQPDRGLNPPSDVFVYIDGLPAQPRATYPYCLRYVSDTSYHAVQCPDAASPTATPWPTYTPAATNTPVVTVTPVSSATTTPGVSATETPEPTPTMETTLPPTQPPMTPTPSMTPTPDLSVCYATVQVNLRLRDAPITGATIGFWAPGDRVIVYSSEFVYFPDNPERVDEWSDVSDLSGTKRGWSAGLYNFNLYMRYDTTAACLAVRFPEPVHDAALLWHTVPGFNVSNAQVSYEILRGKGIEFGLKPYAGMNECIDALDRGGTCIYRHGAPDCPQNIGSADPRQSARDFLRYGQFARDMLAGYERVYYEPVNECYFGSSQSDSQLSVIYWWQAWMDEFITEAVARGYPKLVLPTFGPGHGEPTQYRIWEVVLNRLAAAGGMMGEHAYTPTHDDGLCACDKWLACRHRTNEAYRQAEGVDIDVAITEAARGWGNDPVDVNDFACWYEKVRGDEWLHSVALWTAGWHPTWPNANLDAYMVPIAQGVN